MTGYIRNDSIQKATVKIGGVQFYQDEVLGIDKYGKSDIPGGVFTVQTTFGRFRYFDVLDKKSAKGKNPSIKSGVVQDLGLEGYKGTKNQDTLYLKNSSIMFDVDLSGDKGNKDIIYCDPSSYVLNADYHSIKLDSDDEIWKREW